MANLKSMHQRLQEKGWTKTEIDDTINTIEDPAKQRKHLGMTQDINKAVYWLVLLVLTIGNFFVSLVLVPFMLVLKPMQAEFIAVVMGIILGALFSHLLWNIEHIEPVHHLVAAIFIPVVAIINIFIMVQISNSLAAQIGMRGHENPYLVSIFYAIAFMIPYVYSHVKNWVVSRQ